MQTPLVAVHYHHMLGRRFLQDNAICQRLNLPADCRAWLATRVPLHD